MRPKLHWPWSTRAFFDLRAPRVISTVDVNNAGSSACWEDGMRWEAAIARSPREESLCWTAPVHPARESGKPRRLLAVRAAPAPSARLVPGLLLTRAIPPPLALPYPAIPVCRLLRPGPPKPTPDHTATTQR